MVIFIKYFGKGERESGKYTEITICDSTMEGVINALRMKRVFKSKQDFKRNCISVEKDGKNYYNEFVKIIMGSSAVKEETQQQLI